MNISDLKDILIDVSKLPIIVIIILCTIIIVWVVGWIYTIVEVIIELIECMMCDRRNNCELLIFSEHCPKRHCLNEEKRRQLREKINELDGI